MSGQQIKYDNNLIYCSHFIACGTINKHSTKIALKMYIIYHLNIDNIYLLTKKNTHNIMNLKNYVSNFVLKTKISSQILIIYSCLINFDRITIKSYSENDPIY